MPYVLLGLFWFVFVLDLANHGKLFCSVLLASLFLFDCLSRLFTLHFTMMLKELVSSLQFQFVF